MFIVTEYAAVRVQPAVYRCTLSMQFYFELKGIFHIVFK